MVQRSTEKELKQQDMNGTEIIFLKFVLQNVFEITAISHQAGFTALLHGIPYAPENSGHVVYALVFLL